MNGSLVRSKSKAIRFSIGNRKTSVVSIRELINEYLSNEINNYIIKEKYKISDRVLKSVTDFYFSNSKENDNCRCEYLIGYEDSMLYWNKKNNTMWCKSCNKQVII
jgi:hypothetical protein